MAMLTEDNFVEHFRIRLARDGNRLGSDAEMWVTTEAQARAAYRSVTFPESVAPTWDGVKTPSEVGAERAARMLPPEQSVAACLILLEMLTPMAAEINPEVHADQSIQRLQQLLAPRMNEVVSGYSAYLLHHAAQVAQDHRRQMARDLHDHVANGLVAVQHRLDLVLSMVRAKEDDGLERHVAAALAATQESMSEFRSVMMELRLPEGGFELDLALKALAHSCSGESVDVAVKVSGSEEWAGSEVRRECYLILREALRNALAHSGGNEIQIEVSIAPELLVAVVKDNGCGFDECVAGNQNATGLSAMRERALDIGGQLDIRTSSGGTEVRARVPLRHESG